MSERADEAVEIFRNIIGDANVVCHAPMAELTTFRIGGPADVLLLPQREEEVRELLLVCRERNLPWFILGNGSNLLVSDEGFRGVVIRIDRNLSGVEVDGDTIRAQAGALLAAVAARARQEGLAGLEFAAGIPGTIGGAVAMNAGAYGGEIKDVLESVRAITPDLETVELPAEELLLGYRTSRIKEQGYVVLSASLHLEPGDAGEIGARMEELNEARRAKQPLNVPSAGSTFKRPPGMYAGKLIMEAGLAGFRVGDARVSEKHCGFVINTGHATAADVYALIREVQRRVKEHAGVDLEPEVRFLGEFSVCGSAEEPS